MKLKNKQTERETFKPQLDQMTLPISEVLPIQETPLWTQSAVLKDNHSVEEPVLTYQSQEVQQDVIIPEIHNL